MVRGLVFLEAGALHNLGAVGGAQIVEEFHFSALKINKDLNTAKNSALMISQMFFVTNRGDVIMNRDFR